MLNIFIAYSSKDKTILEIILDNLKLDSNIHYLWHYQQLDKVNLSKEQVLKKLNEVDIFTLIITDNSLGSENVQEELAEAIRLTEHGNIKLICPILIDTFIDPERIHHSIRDNLQKALNPIKAAEIIQEVLTYMSK